MRRALLAFMVLVAAIVGVGCPCARSAVNASPELRWFLFSNFGASQICPEMLKRGVPLKLPQFGAASVGRFFPSHCAVQVDDPRKAIVMNAAGTGYVMLPFTRRVGFYVSMAVEYLPDFRLEEDSTYVWGKFNRLVSQPDMRIMGVENPVVNLATMTPLGNVATVIGNSLIASEIGKGFTVVRQENGDDFTIGHLEPPEKPHRQFVAGKGRVVLESNLTSVYTRSRDFLGPFEIASQNVALFVRARVGGAPVQYTIVERSIGDFWRRQYETALPLSPPPGVIVGTGPLGIGDVNLGFVVNPGVYYVVVENIASAPLLGTMMPIGEDLSMVSYSIEVGDRT